MVPPAERSRAQEGNGRALGDLAHGVGQEADEIRLVHLADEHLLPEGTKDTLWNHARFGGRIGQFAVGEQSHGGAAHLVEFGHWHLEGFAGPALLPDQRSRVAVELSLADMEHLAGSKPVSLIVGDVEAAVLVEAEPFRGPEPAGKGLPLPAIGGDLQDPSAVGHAGIHAACPSPELSPAGAIQHVLAGQADLAPASAHFLPDASPIGGGAEGEIEIALPVAGGAEGKLMVVARHPEAVKDGFVEIGHPVTVGIGDAGEFGTLHDEETGFVLREQPKGLVQALGEAFPGIRPRVVEKYLPPVEAHGEVAVGSGVNATDLRIDPGREGDPVDAEGVRPDVGGGEAGGEGQDENRTHQGLGVSVMVRWPFSSRPADSVETDILSEDLKRRASGNLPFTSKLRVRAFPSFVGLMVSATS